VFLDEIGELPLELQPKLLGVLERRVVRRIGGARDIPVDFRLVAATNRDLLKEMNHGRFREDLYYRMAVVQIHMPALRERLDDVPLLIDHFLATVPGAGGVALSPDTIRNLRNHDYPGNVRELRNMIERAVVMTLMGDDDDMAGLADPTPAPADPGDADAAMYVPIDVDLPYKLVKNRMVEEFDRRYLSRLLERFGGNVSRAAKSAGLDRMTVHKLLSRRGVSNSRRPRDS